MQVDEQEAQHESKETRDQQLMQRFLTGKLNIGSSMHIRRNGHKIIFTLTGKEHTKLQAWWAKKKIHPNRRTVNVKLIVHDKEVTEGYQLTRDFTSRKPPLMQVQVAVIPASYTDINGKAIRTTALVDHAVLPHAPIFYLQDIDCRKGYANLIHFIEDTLKFNQQQADLAAVRAANWRPFITPRKTITELERHTIALDTYNSWLQGREFNEDAVEGDYIDTEKKQIVNKAINRHHHRNSAVKDVFNDDIAIQQQEGKSRDTRVASTYHPTLLLSRFSYSPSPSQASSIVSNSSHLQIYHQGQYHHDE